MSDLMFLKLISKSDVTLIAECFCAQWVDAVYENRGKENGKCSANRSDYINFWLSSNMLS